MPKFGLNIDGDGNPVGLWFNPFDLIIDGNVYLFLSENEMAELARIVTNAVTGNCTGD